MTGFRSIPKVVSAALLEQIVLAQTSLSEAEAGIRVENGRDAALAFQRFGLSCNAILDLLPSAFPDVVQTAAAHEYGHGKLKQQ